MAAQGDIITLSLPYKHMLNINKNILDIRKMVAVEVMKGGK
jgi:predicted dinucleotide-binding enzyme|tara:strand:- start:133 stop:255 length:123 start_codon:yes stop_codon:yes gene_type:complete